MTGQTVSPGAAPRNPAGGVVVNFIPRRKGYAGNVLWAYAAEVPSRVAPWRLGGHPYVTGAVVTKRETNHVATLLLGMGYFASPFPEGDGMIFEPRGGEDADMTDQEVRGLASALSLVSGWRVLVDAAERRPGQAKADPLLPPWIQPRSPAAELFG